MKFSSKLIESTNIEISNCTTIHELEKIRIKYLGKKGYITLEMKKLSVLKHQEKKEIACYLNHIKNHIQNILNIRKKKIYQDLLNVSVNKQKIDVTLLGRKILNGNLHPITMTIHFLKNFFFKLGLEFVSGPEIEDAYHNFDALNIDENHPSRSMHDTFWFDKSRLLRTQTSSMQVRIMKKKKLPIRCIVAGKVYRNDYDSTHTPMFHQMEGLIIDRNINLIQLKWIIQSLLREFFNNSVEIRFRNSYFPFTVPSMEVDIRSIQGEWLEVLGCGMVHPKVFKNLNINHLEYLGCAFGIGIERMAMLKYGISDIRSFFENDIRFLEQFK
ncbi:Phenylalanine--tRNA ligase alpha subunit [Buchnera aphidicola (Eriosoma lanigerum)]|uniref:phenylalanine--tRNA ligase subunit alpha n=1 Tax=Buchnera aphidicola TaxID=9 RepID=UPI0034644D78